MLTPTFEFLKAMSESRMPQSLHQGIRMHPNPRFYKYEWRIFWEGSTVEGKAFLDSKPLATKEAFELIERLRTQGKPYLVYSEQRRRLGVRVWNYQSPRIREGVFAPAYDDDPDPPTGDGHK